MPKRKNRELLCGESPNPYSVFPFASLRISFFLAFPFTSLHAQIRSNFNSRGVNSRELCWFFGHKI